MTIGRKIKQLRTNFNITQIDLANKVKVSKQTLYKYENNIITNIPSDKIELIAQALNTTPAYLMGWEEDNPISTYDNLFAVEVHKYPLLGEIACGEPIMACEDKESYVASGTDIKADFCLKAKGDSMINAKINDGDIVFIQKTNTVENGEIAAVIIDDEVLLKRIYYFKDKNQLMLQSENVNYPHRFYSDEELNHIRILGKAIALQTDLR